jgi:hypothetical protein
MERGLLEQHENVSRAQRQRCNQLLLLVLETGKWVRIQAIQSPFSASQSSERNMTAHRSQVLPAIGLATYRK